MKKHKVKVPEGYEYSNESTRENSHGTIETTIFFKLSEKPLPKTWEELGEINGYYINGLSELYSVKVGNMSDGHKNVWPTKELAEASLALSQLLQLRDVYNDGWSPDWDNGKEEKYVIGFMRNKIAILQTRVVSDVLAFKTAELRDEFQKNFEPLILTAKPLL